LTVINEVGIEDYLRGVVPNEIPHGSLDLREAVKAQTVAARTYAIAYRGQYAAEGYDLLSTVMDQVYSGVEGESEITDRAIRDTRGVVASFQGEAIQTNYSSTCGGHTADRHEVWDKPPLPYLKGVSDKGSDFSFCSTSKYFRWEEGWGGAEFLRSVRENLARENGTRIDSTAVLKDVHVVERGKSGRVKVIEFRTDKGNFRATGDRIRWAIQRPGGAGPLRSTLFDVHAQKDHGRVVRVTLRGRGWGHGVGMCQWGAMERSRQGQSYAQILHHYYRGIRLMTLY
jgi:stage II sporulation protein D